MTYLEELADFTAKIKKGWTHADWDKADAEMLWYWLSVGHTALGIKRRVTGDRERLALDKRIARRFIHALLPLAIQAGVGESQRSGKALAKGAGVAGAQVSWDTCCQEVAGWLERRAALLAAHEVISPRIRGWANSRCHKYMTAAMAMRNLASEWN